MIEQAMWIIISCVGCVAGTLLCVWVGRIMEKISQ